jgi:hypothetical protein
MELPNLPMCISPTKTKRKEKKRAQHQRVAGVLVDQQVAAFTWVHMEEPCSLQAITR